METFGFGGMHEVGWDAAVIGAICTGVVAVLARLCEFLVTRNKDKERNRLDVTEQATANTIKLNEQMFEHYRAIAKDAHDYSRELVAENESLKSDNRRLQARIVDLEEKISVDRQQPK